MPAVGSQEKWRLAVLQASTQEAVIRVVLFRVWSSEQWTVVERKADTEVGEAHDFTYFHIAIGSSTLTDRIPPFHTPSNDAGPSSLLQP